MSLSNVVSIPARVKQVKEEPREVWECRCGCQTFSLFRGGDVECTDCGLTSDSVRHFEP